MIPLGGFRGLGLPPEVYFIGSATYRSTANATNHSIPVHTNTVAGDLVVVLCSTFNSGSYDITPPSGWFSGHTQAYSTIVKIHPFSGVVSGNSILTFVLSSSQRISAVAYTLRGGDAILESTTGVSGTGTTSTPAASIFIYDKKYMGIVGYAIKADDTITSYSSGSAGTASVTGTADDHGVFTSYFLERTGSSWAPGDVSLSVNDGWAGSTVLVYKRDEDDYPNDSFTGVTLGQNWVAGTKGASSSVTQNDELLLLGTYVAVSYARVKWKAPIPTTGTVTVAFDWTPTTVYSAASSGWPYVAIANDSVSRDSSYGFPMDGIQLVLAKAGDSSTRTEFRAGVVSTVFQTITGGAGSVSCAAGTKYTIEWIIDFDAATMTVNVDTVTKINAAAFSYTVARGSHFIEFAYCGYGAVASPTEKFDNIVVTHTA
jgi:hypothetical protein